MKSNSTLLMLLVLFGWPMQDLQSQITLQWAEGSTFHIRKAELLQEDISVWKEDAMPLKKLFHQYTYPSSLQAYKALFYQGAYPSIIDEVYDDWQSKMKGVSTEAQGIFYGQLDSLDVACIQYAFTQAGYKIQMSFLAYQRGGQWYPVEAPVNMVYLPVTGFMAVLQPQTVQQLIHINPEAEAMAWITELKNECQTANGVLTPACLQHVAEKWSMSPDTIHRGAEPQLFKARYQRDLPPAVLHDIAVEMESYLNTLPVPEEGLRHVKYYFSKNEVLLAIQVLQEYGVDIHAIELYKHLNRIQRTQMYRSIDHTSLDTVKQN